MLRTGSLGAALLPGLLLLSGCSGLGKFFGDTITLPGANPNLPSGLSENVERSRGQKVEAGPILPEPGNVWPGPPQPLPTLSDVSRNPGNFLPPDEQHGSEMQDGGSMSLGERNAIDNGAAIENGFSGNGANSTGGGSTGSGSTGSGSSGGGGGGNGSAGGGLGSSMSGQGLPSQVPDAASRFQMKPGGDVGKPIIIPNGDGTSTVVEPDGTVKTVKDAPK